MPNAQIRSRTYEMRAEREQLMAQHFWHVRDCSLFQRLSDSQLEVLEQRARIRKFAKGSTVYLPTDLADGTFLLAEGRIQICSSTPEGKQSILAFIEPGELFGELSLVDGGEREERAEALVNSQVVVLPNDHLKQLMEQNPSLTLGVTKLIGMRRKRIERRLRSLLFRNNRDRLTHLLLELADQYGVATTSGIELSVRLSHQDLAAVIGATRETVTTLLGEMRGEGLLSIQRQKLTIRDLPRLAGEQAGTGSEPSPANPEKREHRPGSRRTAKKIGEGLPYVN